tara:strand:+ start:1165 stop:1809 length:645 start_codon:yes stop_codon:yes gene_type:complete
MNYGEIRTHFKELLNRSDITQELITLFIEQGNQRIARVLRVPAMEHREIYAMSSTGTSEIYVPNVFLETIDMYHSGGNVLDRIPMSKMAALRSNGHNGEPEFYARQQGKFLIYPYPQSGTITLNYYGEFESLYDNGVSYSSITDNNNETTLTKIAPDLLIYAALSYAAIYYLDEREITFEEKYQMLLAELQSQGDDQEISGGTQVINPAYSYED